MAYETSKDLEVHSLEIQPKSIKFSFPWDFYQYSKLVELELRRKYSNWNRLPCVCVDGADVFNRLHLKNHPHNYDVIKWKKIPRYWLFVREHPTPTPNPHKGQWRGALVFSLICTWTNGWANSRGNLRRHRPHYYVTAMWFALLPTSLGIIQ